MSSVTSDPFKFGVKVSVGAIASILLLSLPVLACSGFHQANQERAAHLFTLPLFYSLSFYGVPLMSAILLETLVLKQRESLSWYKALKLTLWATLFYFIAAVGNRISVELLPFHILLAPVLAISLHRRFYQRQGVFKHLPNWLYHISVGLLAVGLSIAHVALLLAIPTIQTQTALYAAIAAMVGLGIIFSWLTKGFAISLFLRDRPYLARSVASMQAASFGVWLLAFSFSQLP